MLEERVVLLASIRSELDHLLVDQNAIIRSHVKRAFQHLDRSLVADSEIRQKWIKAFKEKNGEIACEKLGAAHLLLHGIWAFKANSAGQRTDLILGNTLDVNDEVIEAARGLVLTEWKLVKRNDKPEDVKDIAKSQASLYAGGGLAGFELDSERYLVLVAIVEPATSHVQNGTREGTLPGRSAIQHFEEGYTVLCRSLLGTRFHDGDNGI